MSLLKQRAALSYARWLLLHTPMPAHRVWAKASERHGIGKSTVRRIVRDDLGPTWLRRRADLIAEGYGAEAIQRLPRFDQQQLPL